MLSYLFDLAFVLIVFFTALFVVRKMMMVEAALTFLAVVIASLVAITGFEPIVAWCIRHLFLVSDIPFTKYFWASFAIFIFLLVFAMLQQAFFQVLGDVPQLGKLSESVGCWIFGGLTGYVLGAFLLTVAHTLPVPRDFWGTFEPEAHLRRGPVMAFAPDYQFLSLVDYVCVRRSALTGMPWTVGGPLKSTELDQGYWSAYPIRYAVWREFPSFLASDNGQSDDEYEDDLDDESSQDSDTTRDSEENPNDETGNDKSQSDADQPEQEAGQPLED